MKRTDIGVVIGGVMVALGAFIAVRLLAFRGVPLTGALGLDVAFAAFFLIRGGMQFRRWRQARGAGSVSP
jgi:hypothetical protein